MMVTPGTWRYFCWSVFNLNLYAFRLGTHSLPPQRPHDSLLLSNTRRKEASFTEHLPNEGSVDSSSNPEWATLRSLFTSGNTEAHRSWATCPGHTTATVGSLIHDQTRARQVLKSTLFPRRRQRERFVPMRLRIQEAPLRPRRVAARLRQPRKEVGT